MNFTILITGNPISSQASLTAYHFAKAILKKDHTIQQVFFYQEGVHQGNKLSYNPSDEFNLLEAWQELVKMHPFDLLICSTAALRRGIHDVEQAKVYGKESSNIAAHFKIAGLTQLFEAITTADRFLKFGG